MNVFLVGGVKYTETGSARVIYFDGYPPQKDKTVPSAQENNTNCGGKQKSPLRLWQNRNPCGHWLRRISTEPNRPGSWASPRQEVSFGLLVLVFLANTARVRDASVLSN